MSVALILRNNKITKTGLIPIYLRITINRESKYISTGHAVTKNQWDAKHQMVKLSHPSADIINADIIRIKNDALGEVVDSRRGNKVISARDVMDKSKCNYFDFVDRYREEMSKKRNGATTENYRKHTKKLEEFNGSRNLIFDDINHEYLAAFERHLFTIPKRGNDEKQKIGVNYANVVIRCVRTMFNAARRRGITDRYPFSVYELPSYKQPNKEPLSMEEIYALEEYADDKNKDEVCRTAAIYLLLGINTGLRVSDWYIFDVKKHIKNDMVLLRAKKNNQWVTVPLTDLFRRNIARMEEMPLNIEEQTINEKLKKEIKKEIKTTKHITTHSGRHTFAVTICADKGVSCETCADLMGITVQTCLENYYRVTPEKILAETSRAWSGL